MSRWIGGVEVVGMLVFLGAVYPVAHLVWALIGTQKLDQVACKAKFFEAMNAAPVDPWASLDWEKSAACAPYQNGRWYPWHSFATADTMIVWLLAAPVAALAACIAVWLTDRATGSGLVWRMRLRIRRWRSRTSGQ